MYEKLTGLTSEELLGQNVRVLKNKGIFDTILNPRIVKTHKPETDVQTLQDGKRVVLRGFPVFDDDNELVMVITLVRDVTFMEQMRAQISQQKNLLSIYQHQIEFFSEKDSQSCDLYETPPIEKLSEQVKQVASTQAPILLLGETGVGKDRVARLAHDYSPRKNETFLEFDCSSISEKSMESKLFGYVPEPLDAFTSADSEGKIGYFETANKGTLFFNGICDIPLTLQAKLLRVLQSREVMRVGSPAPRKIDVRIVSATNRNLEDEIKKGNFRKDLYNWLNEAVIDIPPLRRTPEMIPDMVNCLLQLYGAKYKKDITCPDETMSIFSAYRWPGNMLELKNTIQNLVISCEGDEILSQNLPPYMHTGKQV
jgi:transcriptional regulator with PAS, ATPase and Fis domain